MNFGSIAVMNLLLRERERELAQARGRERHRDAITHRTAARRDVRSSAAPTWPMTLGRLARVLTGA